ncbi:rhodanese-like domain-containing protein [bacterium]|nr:rhodanese-like domain-containing protein [bacterium]
MKVEKKIIWLFGLTALAGCDWPSDQKKIDHNDGLPPGVKHIDEIRSKAEFGFSKRILVKSVRAEDLRNMLRRPDKVKVVSISRFEDYKNCRIRGAVSIAPEKILDEVAEWSRDLEVVVYGLLADLDKAKDAAEIFANAGFSQVFVYEPGIFEWFSKGFKVDGPCRF